MLSPFLLFKNLCNLGIQCLKIIHRFTIVQVYKHVLQALPQFRSWHFRILVVMIVLLLLVLVLIHVRILLIRCLVHPLISLIILIFLVKILLSLTIAIRVLLVVLLTLITLSSVLSSFVPALIYLVFVHLVQFFFVRATDVVWSICVLLIVNIFFGFLVIFSATLLFGVCCLPEVRFFLLHPHLRLYDFILHGDDWLLLHGVTTPEIKVKKLANILVCQRADTECKNDDANKVRANKQ